MQTGTVKFFRDDLGWGFIIPDDETADVYVHWKACLNSYFPSRGDIVEYDIKEWPNGQRSANHVQLAG